MAGLGSTDPRYYQGIAKNLSIRLEGRFKAYGKQLATSEVAATGATLFFWEACRSIF